MKTNFISPAAAAVILGLSLSTNYLLAQETPQMAQPGTGQAEQPQTGVAPADAPANQPNNNNQSNWQNRQPISSQQFVWQAATIDLKEVRAGELALEKSDNLDVKAFAKHMIASHKKAAEKLKVIADREGLNFPDTGSIALNSNDAQADDTDTAMDASMDTNAPMYTTTSTSAAPVRGEHATTNAESNLISNMDTNDANGFVAGSIPRGQGSVTNALITNDTDNASATVDTNNMTTETLRGMRVETNSDDNAVAEQRGQHGPDLASLSGVEFDRAYAAKMVLGHKAAIRKFETASAELQDADLKNYAEKMLPTLHAHLRMAEELQSKVGAVSASAN